MICIFSVQTEDVTGLVLYKLYLNIFSLNANSMLRIYQNGIEIIYYLLRMSSKAEKICKKV